MRDIKFLGSVASDAETARQFAIAPDARSALTTLFEPIAGEAAHAHRVSPVRAPIADDEQPRSAFIEKNVRIKQTTPIKI